MDPLYTPEGRLHTLHAWQRHYNMEPREDSALTRLFVEGRVGMTPDQVARELMATDFLYKQTLYGDFLEDFLRRVAARLRETYPGLSWTSTWKIVRFYGPTALKLLCLQAAGVAIPPFLPPHPSPDA